MRPWVVGSIEPQHAQNHLVVVRQRHRAGLPCMRGSAQLIPHYIPCFYASALSTTRQVLEVAQAAFLLQIMVYCLKDTL